MSQDAGPITLLQVLAEPGDVILDGMRVFVLEAQLDALKPGLQHQHPKCFCSDAPKSATSSLELCSCFESCSKAFDSN